MELKQAHRILLDTLNKYTSLMGTEPISEQEFFEEFIQDPECTFIFEAMDTYARAKWDEACNKVRFIWEDQHSMLERHAFFTEGINPDFQP
jgi:hypothetical protein